MLTHHAFFPSSRTPVPRQFELDLSVWTTPQRVASRLRSAGVVVEEQALALLESLSPPPPGARRATFVAATVEDIGLPNGGDYGEVLSAAEARGLYPGPSVAGPLLRLTYRDQRPGEALRVAVSNLARLFVLRRDGAVLALSWDDAGLGSYWDSERTFLFTSSN